jgi:hypothetical protein
MSEIPEPIKRIFAQPEGTVIAVHVRKVDPPQFVAEDLESLEPGEWSGEQCDSCGCCAYTIERNEAFPADFIQGWQARCCGDADEARRWADEGADPAQVEAIRTGCGAVYDLRYEPESRVAF